MKMAYLLMLHSDFELVKVLLRLLDYEDNDIYIHVDKKTGDFPREELRQCCKKSGVFFLENRICVSWGGYSQIACELALMEAAAPGRYDYYHLLSGADLPLKSQAEMHEFFSRNQGREFVGIGYGWTKVPRICERYKYFRPLQDKIGKTHGFLFCIDRVCIFLQRCLRVDRRRSWDGVFEGGPNWFSITDDLLRYVLEQKAWIQKTFRWTKCCDEIFLQTIVVNSPFADKVFFPENQFQSCQRLIDWDRGSPYVWTINELDEMLASGRLFARKIATDTPDRRALVSAIEERLTSR